MPKFEPLDPAYPVGRQVDMDAGPVVMVNLITMATEDEAAFLTAWTADALFMKRQRGFISKQVHRTIGENPTYLNYAVFDSAAAWRGAFWTSEFQEKLKAHPASVIARPHLSTKVAVPDLCTA
ncbi:antibiotic biosynthesis monooxygenase family protein [Burkholderia sp. MSMB1826]|uniref:antibiotic biosynthesis monooxygenase family protein n=1 Tax=Burkholderia sp. MSMB1826 TaxID=1637875 RepID=UPI00075A661B|nr:antibiotic biosynthesis monooxygenase family protein [Burkholderia sp. MSMB1826]KVL13667.1 antibiotic biosynthesis monooxygenase [Burkholderia sp. MSMB1826]